MGMFADDLIENDYNENSISTEMCSNCGEITNSKYIKFKNNQTYCNYCE